MLSFLGLLICLVLLYINHRPAILRSAGVLSLTTISSTTTTTTATLAGAAVADSRFTQHYTSYTRTR